MDPWLSTGNVEREGRLVQKFEDNFEPNARLPDSVEYLASLGNISSKNIDIINLKVII
jgi:hypothetical protein